MTRKYHILTKEEYHHRIQFFDSYIYEQPEKNILIKIYTNK